MLAVQLDDRLIPAERTSRSRRSEGAFVLLRVDQATFVPIATRTDSDPSLADGWAINLLAEMGDQPRRFPTQLTAGSSGLNSSAGLLAGEAAGPVFLGDGLIGYLAGKTDPMSALPADRFIPVRTLSDLLEKGSSILPDDDAPAKSGTPQKGKVFIVRAVVPERLSSE